MTVETQVLEELVASLDRVDPRFAEWALDLASKGATAAEIREKLRAIVDNDRRWK